MLEFLVVVFVGWLVYALLFGRRKAPSQNEAAAHGAPARRARHINTAIPGGGPITSQKAACDALAAVLEANGYGLRGRTKEPMRTTLTDFRADMKEHLETLRSNIEYLADEHNKQREYRDEIAEQLQDTLEDRQPDGTDDDAIARTQRHIGHLDRELAEMAAALAADRQALKDFKADRSAFVSAYALHVMEGTPTPNRGRMDATAS